MKRELKNCTSVLDLGCGPNSLIKICNVPYSVGVDSFLPYIEASKINKIHTKYILSNIMCLDFEPNSFDAVILIEVLEHLTKEDGLEILKKAEFWAKKKVVISTPNGYFFQGELEKNPYQTHLSGWSIEEMKKLGYKASGLGGWKFLRNSHFSVCMKDAEQEFSTIRFRPVLFWTIISELSQAITYFLPKIAFGVIYIKNKMKI